MTRRDYEIAGLALADWVQWAQELGRRCHIPPEELVYLLLTVTDVDRLALRLGMVGDRQLIHSQFDLATLTDCWKQRCYDRIPVQYLSGSVRWRDLDLKVSPAVLIPRPETELLVDLVYQRLQQREFLQGASSADPIKIADLGTGSGAIALGLAKLLPQAEIYGVDCSEDALAIARQNAADHNSQTRFLHGVWFRPLEALGNNWTAIVSNPPYIPSAIIQTLQPEVVDYEPRIALDGGEKGLDAIQHLISQAPKYLCPGGLWAVEHMAGQGQQIIERLKNNDDYSDIQGHCDLDGHDRFVTAIRGLSSSVAGNEP